MPILQEMKKNAQQGSEAMMQGATAGSQPLKPTAGEASGPSLAGLMASQLDSGNSNQQLNNVNQQIQNLGNWQPMTQEQPTFDNPLGKKKMNLGQFSNLNL